MLKWAFALLTVIMRAFSFIKNCLFAKKKGRKGWESQWKKKYRSKEWSQIHYGFDHLYPYGILQGNWNALRALNNAHLQS